MKTLVVIPARGGSKGVPGKNIKKLNGVPLIHYSINIAKVLFDSDDICVSTDDFEIKKVAENTGINIPFIRPNELATDYATSYDVLLHALGYYEKLRQKEYDTIILLQPTSPFRKIEHIKGAMSLFSSDLDMVVAAKESQANPYYNLFELSDNNLLIPSKQGTYTRRQDCPPVYEINGSIYVINVQSLRKKNIKDFSRVVPFLMDQEYSVDIDSPVDWVCAEAILQKGLVLL